MWLFLRFSACYALALILALALLVTLMFFAQNDWMQLLIGSGKPLSHLLLQVLPESLLAQPDRPGGGGRAPRGAFVPAAVCGSGSAGAVAGAGLLPPVVPGMSGHIGLREDARVGARMAARIARLFAPRVQSRPLPEVKP